MGPDQGPKTLIGDVAGGAVRPGDACGKEPCLLPTQAGGLDFLGARLVAFHELDRAVLFIDDVKNVGLGLQLRIQGFGWYFLMTLEISELGSSMSPKMRALPAQVATQAGGSPWARRSTQKSHLSGVLYLCSL